MPQCWAITGKKIYTCKILAINSSWGVLFSTEWGDLANSLQSIRICSFTLMRSGACPSSHIVSDSEPFYLSAC